MLNERNYIYKFTGTPVGMLSSAISFSDMLSRCFMSARRELPCAAINTVRLACRAGAISDDQIGRTLARVV
jgi:hypothetical protein